MPPAVIAGAGFSGVADVGFAWGRDCIDYVDFFGNFRWGGGHFGWIRVGAASCCRDGRRALYMRTEEILSFGFPTLWCGSCP